MKTTAIGAFLFGVGMIGMLDGIVFHQILQWHSVNMHTDRFHQILSDGLFHIFATFIIFIAGIMLLRGLSTTTYYRSIMSNLGLAKFFMIFHMMLLL